MIYYSRAVASVGPGGGRPPLLKSWPPYLARDGIYKVFKYSKITNFPIKVVAILVPGVQAAKAQALELIVVVPRETTSGR